MTEIEVPQVILPLTYVPGRPRTKGSMKAYCTRGVQHKIRMEEQVKDSGAWRKKVAATVQAFARREYGALPRYEVPVELRAVYFFCREDEDMAHEPFPTAITVGDLDKLDRNIGDALTSSGLIKDDKYIVRIVSEKRWGVQAGAQLMLLKVEEHAELLTSYLARAESGSPLALRRDAGPVKDFPK